MVSVAPPPMAGQEYEQEESWQEEPSADVPPPPMVSVAPPPMADPTTALNDGRPPMAPGKQRGSDSTASDSQSNVEHNASAGSDGEDQTSEDSGNATLKSSEIKKDEKPAEKSEERPGVLRRIGSGLMGLFGRGEDSVPKADLSNESEMYYDEVNKCWQTKGAETDGKSASAAPPPKVRRLILP